MFTSIYDVITVSVIGFFVIAILIIIAFVFKKITLKKNDVEVSLHHVSKKDNKITINTSNLIILILKMLQKQEEIMKLQTSVITEQMKYTEQRIELLKEQELKIYQDLLNEQDELKQNEYKIYIKICEDKYSLIKDYFRKSFLENHLNSKEGLIWSKYKEEGNEFLNSLINKHLDTDYLKCLTITKDQLKDKFDNDFKNQSKKIFDEIFNECRNISIDKFNKIKNIRNEMDKYAFNILNIDLNLDDNISD